MNKEIRVMAMYMDLDDLPRAYSWGDISELQSIILCARDMLNKYIASKAYGLDQSEFYLQLEIIPE